MSETHTHEGKGLYKDGVCSSIRPGFRNPTVHGCIRPAGHKGVHINGQNRGWLNSPAKAEEPQHGNK